jgi:two-component system, cell cycle sensor histidine kinase and response regulator CckA
MPGMNGVELVRHMRERHPDLPVLFMSGYADEPPHMPDGLPGTLILKPFSRAAIAAQLNAVLSAQRVDSSQP